MLAKERHDAIIEILNKDDIIRITDIAERFDVSLETARRDLINLNDRGLVTRINGGAILNHGKKPNTAKRMSHGFTEKDAVAKAGAAMVHNGETIFIDAGTTMQLLARNLKDRHYLTVITYSLMVLEELRNTDNEIIMLGGRLVKDESVLCNEDTQKMMSKYFVDKAFFSCMGVSMKDGITDLTDIIDRSVIRNQADQTIMLADSSKWGVRSKIQVAPLDIVDTFIVDNHIDGQILSELRSIAKDVVVAVADDATPQQD